MSDQNHMGKKLRAAVIGCGRMGADFQRNEPIDLPPGWRPLTHAEAIQSTTGLELGGFCDPDRDRLDAAARQFGVEACFTDPAKMLAELSPDIVTIATRTPERCALIRLAAENGVLGIHTEKPFASSMAECKQTMDIVEKNGVKLTFGTIRRFMDIYRTARELVASGAIGDLQHICIEHGRDMLFWSHPHSVDLLIFFAGCHDIEYVQGSCDIDPGAVSDELLDQDPVVENVVVKFANGLLGAITQGGGLNTRLTGSDGTLTIDADGANIEIRRRGNPSNAYFLEPEVVDSAPEMSGTQRAIKELRDAVTGGPVPSISLSDIKCGQHILLAIAHSSIAGGVRTALAEVGDSFTVTGRFGALHA